MRIIAKKLSGAKKACKTFTATCIRSKLYNLSFPRPKNYAARLLTGLRAVTRRLLNVSWKRLPRQRRPPGASFKTSYSAVPHYDDDHQKFTTRKGAFAAIYVDKLYTDHGAAAGETTSKGKEVGAAAESSGGGGGGGCSVVLGTTIHGTDEKREWSLGDAWKAASPEFRGVDERAEEFISKFHKNVEIEREKSILDFHDMLQRSA